MKGVVPEDTLLLSWVIEGIGEELGLKYWKHIACLRQHFHIEHSSDRVWCYTETKLLIFARFFGFYNCFLQCLE